MMVSWWPYLQARVASLQPSLATPLDDSIWPQQPTVSPGIIKHFLNKHSRKP